MRAAKRNYGPLRTADGFKRPTARGLFSSAAAAVVAAMLASCSAGEASSPHSTGAQETDARSLSVGFTAEPASLDFTQQDGAAIPQALLGNVYEGLVKLDAQGRIVPGLASSWQVSQDRRTYTFILDGGAVFASGDPFDADDVVHSITSAKSDWSVSVADVMDVVDSVERLSPTQVRVTLSRPSNDWLFRMTTRVGAMFSSEDTTDRATATNGTGPYTLKQWNRGSSIELEPNPHYRRSAPYFPNVSLKYYKDGTALNNALLSGSIDVISNVSAPESLAQFEGRSDVKVSSGTTTGEVLLAFNNASGPFSDKRVRQAARAAIDKQTLMGTCWAGKGTLIGSMVPPTDPWYEDLTSVPPPNQEHARELLAEAGTPTPAIRLRLPNLPYATSCGQVVKNDLEAVGFTVQMDQLEFPAGWISQVMHGKDFDATIVAHVEPRDMPAVFSPDYYLGYSNPEFARLVTQADTGTPEDEIVDMRAAARLISQDAAADFLFLLPNLTVARSNIEGLPTNSISESFDLTSLRAQ